jgi:hypothetical protein
MSLTAGRAPDRRHTTRPEIADALTTPDLLWRVPEYRSASGIDPRHLRRTRLDWVQSLYGERRSFSEKQFVRFLQEANVFVPVMLRLNLDRRMIIAREHRKDLKEELGSSFDIAVIDTKNNTVLEVIEIKQTARPRRVSDLGGIFKQATDKLDGEFFPLLEASTPVIE